MRGSSYPRRTVLGVTIGAALGGVGLAVSDDPSDDSASPTRDSYQIMEGTEHETTVYVTAAVEDGPTVFVVGGIHGNEEAGWVAANEIADWEIGAGTLVTLPEANVTAIEEGTRSGSDGLDLNRQFPTNEDPETELARAIWGVVESHEPDVVIDLHESTGIYAGDPIDGVGQAIFHSSENEAVTAADRAVEYANEHYVDESELEFMTGGFTGPDTDPEGLLVHKFDRETDGIAFLAETLRIDIDLSTRVHWQKVLVQQMTLEMLHVDASETEPNDVDEAETEDEEAEPEEEPEDPDGPSARIETDPEDADSALLELNQTIHLDASGSTAGEADIEAFEWDIGAEDEFDETGETLDVTISACGEFPVILRVTDAGGRSDYEEIVLSTD